MNLSWNPSLRQWVAIGMIATIILVGYVLWPFLTPLSLSLLLTYVLIPVVDRVQWRTGWPRVAATGFVYLLLLILLSLVPALFAPVIVEQVQELIPPLVRAVEDLGDLIANFGTTTILGQQVNPYVLYQQLSNELISLATSVASSSVNTLFGFAARFVSTVLWLLFILVISFYLVKDSPRISLYFWGLIPRDNRLEVFYLTRRIDRTWNAFLHGQIFLSTVIFTVTTIALLLLGMPQAIFLGFLAGLLNLIPNLGPFLSAIPAVTVALVQGTTQYDISNTLFAVVVALSYLVIQQLESNILVPRIIGGRVQLHPAVVLLGAIIGLSTMGILGIFLAAPVLASLRVIGGYAYRKLLDPEFTPTHVELPAAIAAIPDPREQPPIPIPTPHHSFEGPAWQWRQWRQRFLKSPAPLIRREEPPDA